MSIGVWANAPKCFSKTAQIDFDAEGEMDDDTKLEKVDNAFKSHRVINTQSLEMLAPGALDFRILHRFGDINQGYSQFFGLDQASMRLGFDYGITKNLMAGIGRSNLYKRVAGVWDITILTNRFPSKGFASPVSLGVDIDTGGHVFQLHFTNAVGMNERTLLSAENSDWFRGGFKLGFNISRVFQIRDEKI